MHVGATPVMVDVRDDFNIDSKRVRMAITAKTKAIIPVDFGGWPCDYDALFAVVEDEQIKKYFEPKGDVQNKLGRIAVVADAAHSFGAEYKNKRVGSLADITVFSYHAVKNLTTAEGGAICVTLPSQLLFVYLIGLKFQSPDHALVKTENLKSGIDLSLR